jgi:2-polyprenyl-3-methyl-5-hydroxy-6-metoxy-1,4-benzoquinol methylase
MHPAWACPEHQTELVSENNVWSCPQGHQFEEVHSIPRFVPATSYADHFGAQWNHYRLTQLDSHTKLPITKNRLEHCMGKDLWNSLSGKTVLECGCGAGRFTEVLLASGAKVTSIDLSSAVEANAKNFPVDASHRIAQADILRLPFQPQSFDVVICLGVVQHTPDPEQTITRLYEQVKPGGHLIIDNYQFDWSWYTRTAALLRIVLKRMKPQTSLAITRRLVDFFLPWHRWAKDKGLMWSLVCRLSPLLTYYRAIPQLNEQAQREWSMLDTHDSLTDWYKNCRSPQQIEQYMRNLQMQDIHIFSDGYIVEGRGVRPFSRVLPHPGLIAAGTTPFSSKQS